MFKLATHYTAMQVTAVNIQPLIVANSYLIYTKWKQIRDVHKYIWNVATSFLEYFIQNKYWRNKTQSIEQIIYREQQMATV